MRGSEGKRKGHALERVIFRGMAGMLNRRAKRGTIPPESLAIIPFSGYGAEKGFHFRGRVVEKSGIVRMERRDFFFQNAHKMYKRFLTRPGGGVTVQVRFNSMHRMATTTDQGFFRADFEGGPRLWTGDPQRVKVEVVSPRPPAPVEAFGPVYVPPRETRMGVISDVDDTIVHAHATNPFKMIRLLMFSNASTRMPFPGVRAFYRALHEGRTGRERNPFFYISSSSWEMYDILQDLLHIHDLPAGPIFLRELPFRGSMRDLWRHGHKFRRVREILRSFPGTRFLLVGDSGQRDAEIYSLIVRSFPGRVPAIYIRDVLPTPPRRKRIAQLALRVKEMGSELVLVGDTMAAALHGVARGWISETRLSEIERDRVRNGAGASPQAYEPALPDKPHRPGQQGGGRF